MNDSLLQNSKALSYAVTGICILVAAWLVVDSWKTSQQSISALEIKSEKSAIALATNNSALNALTGAIERLNSRIAEEAERRRANTEVLREMERRLDKLTNEVEQVSRQLQGEVEIPFTGNRR